MTPSEHVPERAECQRPLCTQPTSGVTHAIHVADNTFVNVCSVCADEARAQGFVVNPLPHVPEGRTACICGLIGAHEPRSTGMYEPGKPAHHGYRPVMCPGVPEGREAVTGSDTTRQAASSVYDAHDEGHCGCAEDGVIACICADAPHTGESHDHACCKENERVLFERYLRHAANRAHRVCPLCKQATTAPSGSPLRVDVKTGSSPAVMCGACGWPRSSHRWLKLDENEQIKLYCPTTTFKDADSATTPGWCALCSDPLADGHTHTASQWEEFAADIAARPTSTAKEG